MTEEISTVEDLSDLVHRSIQQKDQQQQQQQQQQQTFDDNVTTINYSSSIQSGESEGNASTINYIIDNNKSIIRSVDTEAARMLDEIDDKRLDELERVRDGLLLDEKPQQSAVILFKPTDSSTSIIKKLKNMHLLYQKKYND